MIKWLCTLPLLNLLYKEGGKDAMMHAIRDVKEMVADDIEERAEELAKEKVRALLSPIDERMIIRFNPREKAVYVGGTRVDDPKRLQNFKAEAEALQNFELWQILYETPKYLAQKALFEDDGKAEIVHTKARSMLYLLDTQKNILATLRSYKQ